MLLGGNRVQRCAEEERLPSIVSNIWGTIRDIVAQLDISKTAKETWEFLKTRHKGAARVIKARVRALQCEFETMFMGEEEPVVDFAGKLSKVSTQLRLP